MISIGIPYIIISSVCWIIVGLLAYGYVKLSDDLIDSKYQVLYGSSISKNYVDFELKVIGNLLDNPEIDWQNDAVTYEVSILLTNNTDFIIGLQSILAEKNFTGEIEAPSNKISIIKFTKNK